MVNEQQIAIGKQVREFLDFIGEQPLEFWEELAVEIRRRDLLQTSAPTDTTLEEMTPDQARVFENVQMAFGKYSGKQIKDIPFSYFCSLLDPTPFQKRLKLYVQYCSKRRRE